MAITDPKEVFVHLLSSVRQGAENAATIYQMMSEHVENPQIREALQARAFVSNKVLSTLDECFRMLDEHPRKLSTKIHEAFIEDFRKELAEIESPEARHLYILAKAHHLNHMRVGEYLVLIEAADMTGHYGLGVLLSSCLADKLAFVERTRHLVRKLAEHKLEMRQAA